MNLKGNLRISDYRRAQTMVEYGVLICIIVATLVAMQVYFKRAVQGKIRGAADEISGDGAYSPAATIGNATITKDIDEISWSKTTGNRADFNILNKQITTSYSGIIADQNTIRNEKTLPFRQEPQRL